MRSSILLLFPMAVVAFASAYAGNSEEDMKELVEMAKREGLSKVELVVFQNEIKRGALRNSTRSVQMRDESGHVIEENTHLEDSGNQFLQESDLNNEKNYNMNMKDLEKITKYLLNIKDAKSMDAKMLRKDELLLQAEYKLLEMESKAEHNYFMQSMGNGYVAEYDDGDMYSVCNHECDRVDYKEENYTNDDIDECSDCNKAD